MAGEVRISVRNLVEFILRSGDIDDRRQGSPENAMQEGSRIHRMIQRRMGAEYQAEVALKYTHPTENYVIIVEGRADGIIEQNGETTIDEIKGTYRDLAKLKAPREAIRDARTFKAGWVVLVLLLVGFFALEPLGVPVSLVAAVAAFILWLVARKGHVIDAGRVLKGAPWQIVIFSLGMYLVVYGLRNAGLTDYLSAALNRFAEHGVWGATLGTGFLTAALSSVMNNMPTVLVGALSIDGSSAQGVVKQAMIYANVIGCDLGPKITPIGSLATLLWLHVLAQKNITISWGYYFRVGIVMTLPVLFVTLAALALRLSV